MKRFACSILTAAALLPWTAQAADDHKPQHGGVVVETKAAALELVAKPDSLTVHFSDHGKPMAVTNATGKATVYNGSEKTEAPLAFVGGKLEAKGNFKIAAGTKVLVETSVNGKPSVAARFTLK